MTGKEFHDLRKKLGISQLTWGRMLGYSGKNRNIKDTVRRYERCAVLPPPVELRVQYAMVHVDNSL